MTSPLLRQALVAVSIQLASFSTGGAVTFPALLMEHFRSNETSTPIDIHTKSWIGSIYGLAGIPAILMPIVMQSIGRKYGYIITCTFLIAGWILTFTATNITEILISESLHGLATNSLLPVCLLTMTEMLAPRYRFVVMQSWALVQVAGIAACGIMGRFLHYRTVSIIMLVPITTAVAIALFWLESPFWLAYKGEFQKCEEIFAMLRGKDDLSNTELKELLLAQRENFSRSEGRKRATFKSFCRNITSRDFYMPSLHIFVLMSMMYWSGCDVIYLNFIEMLAKSTINENAAFYAAIVMYVIIFIGSILTNFLVSRCRHKPVLLSSTFGVIVCLFFGCIITTLQSVDILSKDSPLFMYCILSFMACTSLGLNGMCFMIGAELIPVKYKNIGGALFVIINCTLYASSLKISPYLFTYIGFHGTFVIYLVSTISCALFVRKYVPETKGRTLQEIEDYYVHGRFIHRRLADTENDTAVPINN